jgi:hypothetical protein
MAWREMGLRRQTMGSPLDPGAVVAGFRPDAEDDRSSLARLCFSVPRLCQACRADILIRWAAQSRQELERS